MALTDNSELYAWGAGNYGECGYGEVIYKIKIKCYLNEINFKYCDTDTPKKVNINFN